MRTALIPFLGAEICVGTYGKTPRRNLPVLCVRYYVTTQQYFFLVFVFWEHMSRLSVPFVAQEMGWREGEALFFLCTTSLALSDRLPRPSRHNRAPQIQQFPVLSTPCGLDADRSNKRVHLHLV